MQTNNHEATPHLIEVPSGLVRFKEKYWRPVDADGFKGYRPWLPELEYNYVDKTSLSLEWTGGKIPLAIWRQICAWFEKQFALTDGEAQVRLYYNHQLRQWKAWAFPQEWSTGMTTRELGHHPDKEKQYQALGEGFICYGSVHHHCKGGAFASSVDTHNETDQNGIHITVGKIGSAEYDLHGRVYFGKQEYGCNWEDWFDLNPVPDWVHRMTNREEKKQVIAWCLEVFKDASKMLRQPPDKDTPFPQQWMDNLIKITHVGYQGNYNGNGGGHGGQSFQGASQGQSTSRTYRGTVSIPTPIRFTNNMKDLIATGNGAGLTDAIIVTLLEELVCYESVNYHGKSRLECGFMNSFMKVAHDNDMYPTEMAARMAIRIVNNQKPDNDGETLCILMVCAAAGEAKYSWGEAVRQIGLTLAHPQRTAYTDIDKSFLTHLKQISCKTKVSLTKLCEAFSDYVDEDLFNKTTNQVAKEALVQSVQDEQAKQQLGADYCGGY